MLQTGITEGGLSSTWDNGFIYGVSTTFLSLLLAISGYILIDYAAVIFLSITDQKKVRFLALSSPRGHTCIVIFCVICGFSFCASIVTSFFRL